MQNSIEIAVKNMVCNRCIKVVKEELTKNNINFTFVDLGKIYTSKPLTNQESETLKQILKKEGFELVEDKEAIIVNKIKALYTKNFLLEAFFGVVKTFIIGWLVGANIATFYNVQIKK
jgi:glutaredoxin-related protein